MAKNIKCGTTDQLQASDSEIAMNNRLFLLVGIHQRRQGQSPVLTSTPQKQQRSKEMGKPTGVCEQCGKENTRLPSHFNVMACPSCTAMRGFVKNKPEIVVAALREFHGERYFPVPVDVPCGTETRAEYVDALERAHEIEHAWCIERRAKQENDLLYMVANYMSDIVDLLFPGIDPTMDTEYMEALELSVQTVRDMVADQERLAQKAVVVAAVRSCLNIETTVPDERMPAILHDALQPPTLDNDALLLGEIAAHLGMEHVEQRFTASEIIEGVASMSMAFGQAQQRCHELTETVSQQREQLNALTSAATVPTSLAAQVAAARPFRGTTFSPTEEAAQLHTAARIAPCKSTDSELLDLALAVLRGDVCTIADTIELQRKVGAL